MCAPTDGALAVAGTAEALHKTISAKATDKDLVMIAAARVIAARGSSVVMQICSVE
jgi:hypothetical protein